MVIAADYLAVGLGSKHSRFFKNLFVYLDENYERNSTGFIFPKWVGNIFQMFLQKIANGLIRVQIVRHN